MHRTRRGNVLECIGVAVVIVGVGPCAPSRGDDSVPETSTFKLDDLSNPTTAADLNRLLSQVAEEADRPIVRELYRRGVRVTPLGKRFELQFHWGLEIPETAEEQRSTDRYLDSRLESAWPFVRKLSSVYSLHVYGIRAFSDARIEELGPNFSLYELRASNTGVTDEGLRALSKIRTLARLHVAHTRVTDVGVRALAASRELRVLDLSSTRVTDAGLRALRDCRHLSELSLEDTRVTSAGLEVVAALPKLEFLELSRTAIDDQAAEWLKDVAPLRFLGLDETRLSSEGYRKLLKTVHAKGVGLRKTAVDDAAIHALATKKQVCPIVENYATTRLWLDHTNVTDEGIAAFTPENRMEVISLHHSKVTEDGVRALNERIVPYSADWRPDVAPQQPNGGEL